MAENDLDSLISTALCGQQASWPVAADIERGEAFIDRVRYHGVTALLHERCSILSNWPHQILEAIRSETLAEAMWELRHQQVLSRLIGKLAERGITPLLFKGTALAYSLYDNPVWRQRGDTDIIVAPDDVEACREILSSQLFKRETTIPGEFVSYQESWTFHGPEGASHSIDLHRRISNSELLAQLFSYQELRASARPLPSLCQHAISVGLAHAFLLASIHRQVHKRSPYTVDGIPRYGGDRLIWLYDLHLLAQSMKDDDWADMINLARDKGLRAVCFDGLKQARKFFETRVPDAILAELQLGDDDALPAVYLNANANRRQLMDFWALPGLRKKMSLLKEVIFPHEFYIRTKFPEASQSSLPYLYARRAFKGVLKNCRRGH